MVGEIPSCVSSSSGIASFFCGYSKGASRYSEGVANYCKNMVGGPELLRNPPWANHPYVEYLSTLTVKRKQPFSHSQRAKSGIFRQNQALSGKIRHFQAFSGAICHDFT